MGGLMRHSLAGVLLLSLLAGCEGVMSAVMSAPSGAGGGHTGKGLDAGSSGGGGGVGGDTTDSGSWTSEVRSELPPLPPLTSLQVRLNGNSANITFDPVDKAKDYRIYPLPPDGGISVDSDGRVTIRDAVYRCSGAAENLHVLIDQPGVYNNTAGGTSILNGKIQNFTRTEADATLGYVFQTPGPGRIPVYALGSPDLHADGSCGRPLFRASRAKTYTTDAAKRDQLIAAHARDDGIAFFVPTAAGANTRPIYEGVFGDHVSLRWTTGAEAAARGSGTTLFNVLSAASDDAVPLMRVYLEPACAWGHDELIAGMPRFLQTKFEGDRPLPALHWAGLSSDTVLVVEALDEGCPYQGHFSPVHAAAATLFSIPYPEFVTLEDQRQRSSTQEVFINGQYAATGRPRAIARAYVAVKLGEKPAMDFYDTFDAPLEPMTQIDINPSTSTKRYQSATYDLQTFETAVFYQGATLGEFWFTYADIAADVNGKIRLTAKKKATLAADSFLHVTMEVNILSTARRYPQLIISDRDAPVQSNLLGGHTLLIQPKDLSPTFIQVEVCDHRYWDVNLQCPILPTFASSYLPPVMMPSELVGVDRTVKIDAYVSTGRLYLTLDGAPYSCTDFPAKADDGKPYTMVPPGPVTVTWGDVLYHSYVDFATGDGLITYPIDYVFSRAKMQTVSRRHLDSIGFTSGVAAPAWDEKLHPCVSQ
jgi:hypothetical protein